MADTLDHLLSDYFTGRLEANIKLRKLELRYMKNGVPDENIGGGRKQNDYSNPIEAAMIKEERDDKLQTWLLQKEIVSVFFGLAIDNHQRILKARYGNGLSWVAIAQQEHVDVRTCIRWRDDFKDGIMGHLLATLKPMSFLSHKSGSN